MKLDQVERGLETPGKRHMRRHLCGERLSLREAVAAKCFECMGGYADGRMDCRIRDCALYEWMPFREVKPAKDPVKVARMAAMHKKRKEQGGSPAQGGGNIVEGAQQ